MDKEALVSNENVENILEVEGLCKSFRSDWLGKKIKVLDNVSFKIPKGAVVGFLGVNGAGKTTTMKCLLRLIFADHGSISFFNSEDWSVENKSRIGFLPERPNFYDYLTGNEFLTFHGEMSGRYSKKRLKQRITELLEQVGLAFAGDRMLRKYSKGMLQRIGIAQALIHSPDFVILDEPMGGLDPDGRFEVGEVIKNISKEGATIFFSSHLLHDVEKLCDYLVILKRGTVFYEGPTSQFLKNQNSLETEFSLLAGKGAK